MSEILLTGGSGFIGGSLLKHPSFKNATMIGRNKPKDIKNFIQFDFYKDNDYDKLFKNVKYVIHLAGLAHENNASLNKFLKINYEATKSLAESASRANVKKFIYLSSIKVLGDFTNNNLKFKNNSPYDPKDNYSYSKVKAEEALMNIAQKSKMDVVIIRPPLVYGEKVKGNFERLINLVNNIIILPFKNFKNKRSFLSVNNLVDLIDICLTHKNAKNKIYLICDADDLSTSQLIAKISRTKGKKNLNIYFPIFIIRIFFLILGKKNIFDKLYQPLQVDQKYTLNDLGWFPKFKMDDELKKICNDY